MAGSALGIRKTEPPPVVMLSVIKPVVNSQSMTTIVYSTKDNQSGWRRIIILAYCRRKKMTTKLRRRKQGNREKRLHSYSPKTGLFDDEHGWLNAHHGALPLEIRCFSTTIVRSGTWCLQVEWDGGNDFKDDAISREWMQSAHELQLTDPLDVKPTPDCISLGGSRCEDVNWSVGNFGSVFICSRRVGGVAGRHLAFAEFAMNRKVEGVRKLFLCWKPTNINAHTVSECCIPCGVEGVRVLVKGRK